MIHLQKDGATMDIALLGAEMREFQSADGKQRLWSGSPEVWKSTAPVLFPVIGMLKNGAIEIEGKTYQPPKHGFAKLMPFEVSEQGEDFVTLTLKQNEETKKVYPFDFALSVTHRFVKDGFETRYTVENHSSRAMPFAIGGHPGFRCPMNEGERFEDYVLRFEKPETGEHLLCTPEHYVGGSAIVELGADQRTLPLCYADYDRLDTYMFAGLHSRSVELVHRQTGKGIRVSFPEMEVLAIWTMPLKQAPYLCIEPWQGMPAYAEETGRFEDKPYHVKLGVGCAYTCGYRMEVI